MNSTDYSYMMVFLGTY